MAQEHGQKNEAKSLGLFAALFSLGYVFWILGSMEMIERLSFYGIRGLVSLYTTDPVSSGGLGISTEKLGIILMVWSALQGFLPMFLGSIADHYGYKKVMFVSTAVKTAAFLIMAFMHNFAGFFLGAVILAIGTSIWVPGVQGAVAKTSKPENTSMAWGIFYQTVNLGAFISPLIAGYLRKMSWSYVFLACALVGAVNFILLIFYKEEESAEEKDKKKKEHVRIGEMFTNTLRTLKDPKMFWYLAIFTGFYCMYSYVFDVLTIHIQDWVDSRDVVASVKQFINIENPIVSFFMVLDKTKTYIQPEGILNVNCALIMSSCFVFSWLSSKLKILNSISLGLLFCAVSMILLGLSHLGWICIFAVIVFTIGEMFSNVKFSEFVGSYLAPEDKKATYLGVAQMSFAISATIEGYFGPKIYGMFCSKDVFARQALEKFLSASEIEAIPNGEAFNHLVSLSGVPADILTKQMYHDHHVAYVWYILGIIGVLSVVCMIIYSLWFYRRTEKEKQA